MGGHQQFPTPTVEPTLDGSVSTWGCAELGYEDSCEFTEFLGAQGMKPAGIRSSTWVGVGALHGVVHGICFMRLQLRGCLGFPHITEEVLTVCAG